MWVGQTLISTAENLFALLFPSDCRICSEPLLNISRLPVCPDCLAEIQPISGRLCSICGERVLSSYAASYAASHGASYAEPGSGGLTRCAVCRRIKRPFEQAVAYGSYDSGLRELIHLLKYSGVRPAAGALGRMLAETIGELTPEFGDARVIVIPVPLYKGRRRERGFNQAALISRAALKHLSEKRFELRSDLLERTRDTRSQIGLTNHQRRENLRGAFTLSRPTEVTGRAVLLVDDVYTTGATATECATVLRRAGAAKVWVATVARTLKLASNEGEFEASGFEGFTDDADGDYESEQIAVAKR